MKNTGERGSGLRKKESLVNEYSVFNSTELDFEDNILNSTVTDLNLEDEEISV